MRHFLLPGGRFLNLHAAFQWPWLNSLLSALVSGSIGDFPDIGEGNIPDAKNRFNTDLPEADFVYNLSWGLGVLVATKSKLGRNEEPGRSVGHILLLRTAGFLVSLPFCIYVSIADVAGWGRAGLCQPPRPILPEHAKHERAPISIGM